VSQPAGGNVFSDASYTVCRRPEFEMDPMDWEKTLQRQGTTDDLKLEDGSRVAVVGGGPAGSFFSYFLLEMATPVGMDIHVDIYEPRDFDQPAPRGCNMCGGIISETLVQNLATEGINLPPTVVQRGIDSYVLHMDVGSVRIATPLQEMRIGAVTRGSGKIAACAASCHSERSEESPLRPRDPSLRSG